MYKEYKEKYKLYKSKLKEAQGKNDTAKIAKYNKKVQIYKEKKLASKNIAAKPEHNPVALEDTQKITDKHLVQEDIIEKAVPKVNLKHLANLNKRKLDQMESKPVIPTGNDISSTNKKMKVTHSTFGSFPKPVMFDLASYVGILKTQSGRYRMKAQDEALKFIHSTAHRIIAEAALSGRVGTFEVSDVFSVLSKDSFAIPEEVCVMGASTETTNNMRGTVDPHQLIPMRNFSLVVRDAFKTSKIEKSIIELFRKATSVCILKTMKSLHEERYDKRVDKENDN